MKNATKRSYLFIDAENHFIRSTSLVEQRLVERNRITIAELPRFSDGPSGNAFPSKSPALRIDHTLQLYWHCNALNDGRFFQETNSEIVRAIHVFSYHTESDKHELSTAVRDFGFEPYAILEKNKTNNNELHL